MSEVWKAVPEHLGYEVSDLGRVRSYKGRGRQGLRDVASMMSPVVRGGYPEVRVTAGKGRPVHLLVLESFVGPRPTPEHECRHLNGNPLDARLENLTWGTRPENYADRRGHGTANDGERHGNASIDNQMARAICVAEGPLREVAKRFQVSIQVAGLIRRGQSWRRVTGAPLTHPGTAGEHNGRARLTDEVVLDIRKGGGGSDELLARRYGVCRHTIALARTGKTWKHLPV